MKKLAVTLALVLGLGFTQANAQNLSYGVKANANMLRIKKTILYVGFNS